MLNWVIYVDAGVVCEWVGMVTQEMMLYYHLLALIPEIKPSLDIISLQCLSDRS